MHAYLDVTDPATVAELLGSHPVDVVVHLASIVTPGRDSDREREYAVDVTGTQHVLDACRAHGVRRVVVSSSGAAYGYHPDNPVPLRESDPLRGNEAFAYSHHKRLAEELLSEYADLDGTLTIDEIAAALRKPTLTLPEGLLKAGLRVGRRLGLTAYGPEQTVFLEHRPVLTNDRLKNVFGYTPAKTSAEAFEAWRVRPRG